MANAQCSIPQWLNLKPEVKKKLREVFQIPRTGVTEVITDFMGRGTVICDGTTHKDLSVITIEKLQEYLGFNSIDNFYTLFDKTITQMEQELCPEIVMTGEFSSIEPLIEEPEPEKRSIECPICKSKLLSKDERYDERILNMHSKRFHKEKNK